MIIFLEAFRVMSCGLERFQMEFFAILDKFGIFEKQIIWCSEFEFIRLNCCWITFFESLFNFF